MLNFYKDEKRCWISKEKLKEITGERQFHSVLKSPIPPREKHYFQGDVRKGIRP